MDPGDSEYSRRTSILPMIKNSDGQKRYSRGMKRFSFAIAICLLALSLAVLAAAREGGRGLARASDDLGCAISVRGTKSRIRPRTSRLTCGTIKQMLAVLPGAVGTWSLEGSTPAQNWTCRVYPRSKLPLEIRCHHHSRYFEVVAKD
jgi:hypothetical protein